MLSSMIIQTSPVSPNPKSSNHLVLKGSQEFPSIGWTTHSYLFRQEAESGRLDYSVQVSIIRNQQADMNIDRSLFFIL